MTDVRRFKPKKCRVCRGTFEPFRPLQVCCTTGCAIQYAAKQREKKERKELKQAKERIKSRRDWQKEAQAAFNGFIRARDKDKPCISCGRFHTGSYDAGHYRTAGGNPELRFNEDNCHRQCVQCNQHLHGNIVNYRIGLIDRIGIERVEVIEGKHEAQHYSIEDLKSIKETYSRKARELLKGALHESNGKD